VLKMSRFPYLVCRSRGGAKALMKISMAHKRRGVRTLGEVDEGKKTGTCHWCVCATNGEVCLPGLRREGWSM
jgi:hypothetical protein